MKRFAIALVAVLALAGCTEIGSLSDKAQIDLALNNLTNELDELAGITTEYTAELQADYSYQVGVSATSPALSEQQLVAAAILARDELGAGVFERHLVRFELYEDDGSVLSIGAFDLENSDIQGDIAYATAFGEAYGAPASVFFGEGNTADSYGRVVSTSVAVAAPDWDAIRALPDETRADRSWQVPGFSFSGEVPDARLTDIVDGLAAIVQTADGLTFDMYGSDVTLWDPAYSDLANPESSGSWTTAVQVAAYLATSQLPLPHLLYYGDGDAGGSGIAVAFHGECPVDGLASTPEDAALATALASALGDDLWAPGYCPLPA